MSAQRKGKEIAREVKDWRSNMQASGSGSAGIRNNSAVLVAALNSSQKTPYEDGPLSPPTEAEQKASVTKVNRWLPNTETPPTENQENSNGHIAVTNEIPSYFPPFPTSSVATSTLALQAQPTTTLQQRNPKGPPPRSRSAGDAQGKRLTRGVRANTLHGDHLLPSSAESFLVRAEPPLYTSSSQTLPNNNALPQLNHPALESQSPPVIDTQTLQHQTSGENLAGSSPTVSANTAAPQFTGNSNLMTGLAGQVADVLAAVPNAKNPNADGQSSTARSIADYPTAPVYSAAQSTGKDKVINHQQPQGCPVLPTIQVLAAQDTGVADHQQPQDDTGLPTTQPVIAQENSVADDALIPKMTVAGGYDGMQDQRAPSTPPGWPESHGQKIKRGIKKALKWFSCRNCSRCSMQDTDNQANVIATGGSVAPTNEQQGGQLDGTAGGSADYGTESGETSHTAMSAPLISFNAQNNVPSARYNPSIEGQTNDQINDQTDAQTSEQPASEPRMGLFQRWKVRRAAKNQENEGRTAAAPPRRRNAVTAILLGSFTGTPLRPGIPRG